MLVDARCKLSEAKAWAAMAAQAGVEATKEYHNDRMQYVVATYLIDKNEVQSKVTICFPGLDLMFLDVESEKSDNEFTSRPKGATRPLGGADLPLAA